MSARPRIALVTCRELPTLDADDGALIPALAQRGVDAVPAVWDDPFVEWNSFDLVVVRSPWDYAGRRPEFLAWAATVDRLVNPAEILAWNTDKHYLLDLERAGVPVVPTTWLEPDQHLGSRGLHTRFPSLGDFVIKPAVSTGSLDTGRYTSADAYSRGLAIDHAKRLMDSGRTAMVQRYVDSVDVAGEVGLLFIDGRFSHAIRKSAMLDGPDAGAGMVRRVERIRPHEASEEEIAAAGRALSIGVDVAPLPDSARGPLLYARVDLVAGENGPLLLELELARTPFFLSTADGALGHVVDAIAGRVQNPV